MTLADVLALPRRLFDWIAGHKKGWLAVWSATLLGLCVWTTVVAVRTARALLLAGKAAEIDLPHGAVYCFLAVLLGYSVDSLAGKGKPPAPAPDDAPPAGGGEAEP